MKCKYANEKKWNKKVVHDTLKKGRSKSFFRASGDTLVMEGITWLGIILDVHVFVSACQKKWWAPFQLGCETAELSSE